MFRNKTDKWYHVHVNEQDIVCTAGHPFYVADLETFVPAKDLKVGQSVLLADGTCAVIEEIRVQKLRAPETTYNFEVEDYHTYYVSDDKVLVHNKCIFDELGVTDFGEVGKKYTPGSLVDRLDELGYAKEISMKNPKSPAVIMRSADGKLTFRIQSINPQGGRAYFRVFNSGNNPLAANGLFPTNANKLELRKLTHFYFGE